MKEGKCIQDHLQSTIKLGLKFNWGKLEQAPLLRGKQCGGPCAKNRDEKRDCNTLLYSLGAVVHVQTNTINLRILPYKCIIMQKYLASFTDIPY